MTKMIIGFFCGTDYIRKNDKLYESLRSNVNVSKTTLLAYDGCQSHGGLFAIGIQRLADVFIADLKKEIESLDNTETIQINFIAHSHGCFSALLAIKKMQADPELRARIRITVDLHELVPRNFRWSTAIGGNLMIANMVHDLSECDLVKHAHLTLHEKGLGSAGWDAFIPKFHAATSVEVEALPGWYDVQHNGHIRPEVEHTALFQLGAAKTMAILHADSHDVNSDEDTLNRQQTDAYNEILIWVKSRTIPFEERNLHYGGHLIANNTEREGLEVINWRHAQLIAAVPEHVLYGVTHPYYNYKKTDLEHYCNFTLILDTYLAIYPEHDVLVQELKDCAQAYLAEGHTGIDNFYTECQKSLNKAAVYNKQLYVAINSLCVNGYFLGLCKVLDGTSANNVLHYNLQSLTSVLEEELNFEICLGKNIILIQSSEALRVAKSTVAFLSAIYAPNVSPESILIAATDYVKENMCYGRHWSVGNQVLASLVLGLAAAVVGCMAGAVIGLGIGLAAGAITGSSTLITTLVSAFLGSFQWGMITASVVGATVGLAGGGAASYGFFALSARERQVQELADAVIYNEGAALSS
ncbi:MAG: hypothetical protein P4L79_05535 [Legionella sp.]|uniref:hypothetical protein n=1 Tax=Legionella sp. TaxID=459 RepID=UPI0028512D18|nr:hypothetical protein [Legionella sp.]